MKGCNCKGKGNIFAQSSYGETFRSQTKLIDIEGGLGWDLDIDCCIGHAGNNFDVATVAYFEQKQVLDE